jgi:vacuolar-type H+-ATPase subunit E/Vma4
MSDMFDFGFTAVDEEELKSVQAIKQEKEMADDTLEHVQAKLDKLYNAIVPLLNNLKKNPEKDYILWPDRLSKVEAFETHLQDIYKS